MITSGQSKTSQSENRKSQSTTDFLRGNNKAQLATTTFVNNADNTSIMSQAPEQNSNEANLTAQTNSSSSVTSTVFPNVAAPKPDLELKMLEIAKDVQCRTQELCERLSIRPHWPHHEHPPRKMPYNDQLLTTNDPTKGSLHKGDRDLLNPNQRLQPRSTYGLWLGQINAFSHENQWTDGPWG